MSKEKKIRISYTLLSYWDRGDIAGAVDCYFHTNTKTNEAMEHGKKVHKELEEYIAKHNMFPEWFFKYDLNLPETEKKMVVGYNSLFDLSGIYDCYDSVSRTLFEFKTGTSDSLAWARTWQLPLYFLMAELSKTPLDKAILIRNNRGESDFTIVHNSKRLRDRARNIVDSLGPEIWQYFNQEGLI